MEFSQTDCINDDSHNNSHKLDYFNSFISYEIPAHVAAKKDLKIKDMVKEHVLPLLPAKSLTKFRAVSKEWDKWIASPLLAHQQSFSCQTFSGYFYQDMETKSNTNFLSLDHSTFGVPSPTLDFLPFQTVEILSSCCGVLLCQGSENYYVCNPATRDWKMLPPQYYHGKEPAVVLAFEPSLHNIEAHYHVICAFPMIGQPIICFDIYSSESNSWSCSSADCTDLGNPRLVGGGLFLKGVAYYETKSNQVLAFDVKDEIPAVISLPVQFGRHGSLTQMEGELCYVTVNNESGSVFIIDIYQGMKMSLKRSVSINLGSDRSLTQSYEVLPCVNSDAVAIHIGQFIYFYHIREQKVEFIITSACARGFGKKFLPYINSLAMLH